jgi:hypothetical protein
LPFAKIVKLFTSGAELKPIKQTPASVPTNNSLVSSFILINAAESEDSNSAVVLVVPE